MELPFGLATSVGDLPFDDAETSVEFALSLQPTFPTVPIANVVGKSLLAQACAVIDGADITSSGSIGLADGFRGTVEPTGVDLATGAFELTGAFLDRLPAHISSSTGGFAGVRIGILGPTTLALRLRAAGAPIETAVSAAPKAISYLSTQLLARFRAVAGSTPLVIVMSEPGLVGAMHPTFPLGPSEVTSTLVPVIDALDQLPGRGDILIGVHVAGPTDWGSVITSGVSLISTPAEEGLASSAPVLARFLDFGGTIAWGAVPVDQPLGTSEELLWRRLGGIWCSLVGEGLDPFQLRACSLVGPVDGLGNFGASQAARVIDLVDSLSDRIRRQAIGARLSLGA